METCPDCRNVLPRTVDRCTVCGLVRRVDEPVEPVVEVVDDGTPGWAPSAPPEAPSGGLHPDDFLRELGEDLDDLDDLDEEDFRTRSLEADPFAADQPARPQRPTRRDQTNPEPVFAAESASDSWDSEPLPRDFATALSEVEPVAETAPAAVPPLPVGAMPAPPAPPADPPERASAPEHGPTAVAARVVERTRPESIAAASTRVQGNVKVGPTPNHHLVTIGHGVAAIILLALGLLLAYPGTADETAEPNPAPTDAVPEDLQLAYGVPIADIETRADAAVVSLMLNGCGLTGETSGVVLDERTVLARRSDLLTDVRPTIVRPDGSSVGGRVAGWSATRDLAVVKTFGDLAGGVNLGGESRVHEGTGVFVVALAGGADYEVEPLPVLDRKGRDGTATSIVLDTDAVLGSPVLDTAGLMVAVVHENGEATLAGDVRSWVSRVITTDQNPRAVCPAPPVTESDDNGVDSDADTGEDAGD